MATVELSRSQNNNLTRVYVGDLILWFSYETIVAFHAPGSSRRVCENVWSQTTGRHLNEIDGGSKEAKAARLSHDVFTVALDGIMARLNATLVLADTER